MAILAVMSDVTRILSQIESGDPQAAEELLPLVYDELRKLAATKLAHEQPGQTLQATALVHEAYLRLVGGGKRRDSGLAAGAQRWDSRGHFFAAAAEAMRRIVVERARARATLKRGGNQQRMDLDELGVADDARSDELLAIDDALSLLQEHDPQAALLVKLRFFAGMPHQEAAAAMGISRRAADRLWTIARAWLYRQVTKN
jgi:RNA polymerase sigma factor (TIGR02999 family)